MAAFLYRCPSKNKTVQGWTADEVAEDGDAYVPVQCYACRRLHYVNPTKGKVLGADTGDEDE
jgi:hypothetical protein